MTTNSMISEIVELDNFVSLVDDVQLLDDVSDEDLPGIFDNPYHVRTQDDSPLPLQEQLDYLELDMRFEVKSSQLTIGERLGAGFFSEEAIGTLTQPIGKVPVAVKMPKSSGASQTGMSTAEQEANFRNQRKCLRNELKIMTHLQALSGGHNNVLKLIGAITTIRDDFCVLTEYCDWGSMDHFLRDKFNDGKFENEIEFEENGSEEIWKNRRDTNWEDNFEIRRENGQITTSDLVWFALQIARAMQFLTERKVLHRDAALRNVLIKPDYTLKVADFGLSRKLNEEDEEYFLKNNSIALPIRYMAPESLISCRFTVYSECWSFGVVVWELFTFALKQPYTSEFENDDSGELFFNRVINFLSAGYRLTLPEIVPGTLKDLVNELWNEDPEQRPSFQTCRKIIRQQLMTSCQKVLHDEQTGNLHASEMSLFNMTESKQDKRRRTYNLIRNFLSVSALVIVVVSAALVAVRLANRNDIQQNSAGNVTTEISLDQNSNHIQFITSNVFGNDTHISVLPNGNEAYLFQAIINVSFVKFNTWHMNFVTEELSAVAAENFDVENFVGVDVTAVTRSWNTYIITLNFMVRSQKLFLVSYAPHGNQLLFINKVEMRTESFQTFNRLLQDEIGKLYYILYYNTGHYRLTTFFLDEIIIDDSGTISSKNLNGNSTHVLHGEWTAPFVRAGALYWALQMHQNIRHSDKFNISSKSIIRVPFGQYFVSKGNIVNFRNCLKHESFNHFSYQQIQIGDNSCFYFVDEDRQESALCYIDFHNMAWVPLQPKWDGHELLYGLSLSRSLSGYLYLNGVAKDLSTYIVVIDVSAMKQDLEVEQFAVQIRAPMKSFSGTYKNGFFCVEPHGRFAINFNYIEDSFVVTNIYIQAIRLYSKIQLGFLATDHNNFLDCTQSRAQRIPIWSFYLRNR